MATASTDVPLVVVIGDLHAGSAFAPCPATFKMEDDVGIFASRVQTWLYQCWQHFTTEYLPAVLRRRKFVLVLTGDLIEGVHHGGQQLVWRSEAKHAEIAVNLLRPIASKAQAVYLIAGTEVHTKSWEEHIGKELGGIQDETTDRYAPDDLDLNVCGCLTSFRHHVPTTTRRGLGGTQCSIQLVEEQASAAGALTPIPRVVVRSHAHLFRKYSDGDGATVITPSWKLFDRHTHKAVQAALRSAKVGAVVMDYSLCKDPHDLPVIAEKLYRPT